MHEVDANPTAQTATVTFDPTQATVGDLRGWVLGVVSGVGGDHRGIEGRAGHEGHADAPGGEPTVAAPMAGHDHHGGDGSCC